MNWNHVSFSELDEIYELKKNFKRLLIGILKYFDWNSEEFECYDRVKEIYENHFGEFNDSSYSEEDIDSISKFFIDYANQEDKKNVF